MLADILVHCEPETNEHILSSLRKVLPQAADELKKKIVTFDDLGRADSAGVQKLLRRVSLRDLAISLKGAAEGVLANLAQNMSSRAVEDLREEITVIGSAPQKEVEAARRRILGVLCELRDKKELFFLQHKAERWID